MIVMKYLPFFTTKNLAAETLTQTCPWEFRPGDKSLADMRSLPKERRRDKMAHSETAWNVYSPVGGLAPNQRVGKDNPACGIRGLVADYDLVLDVEQIQKLLAQIDPVFHPNFIEVSLGKKARLVWVFEREILMRDNATCQRLIELFFDRMRVAILLPGYDSNSVKPSQVWTNGGEWHLYNPDPVPWPMIVGMAVDANKIMDDVPPEIPLDIIEAEVRKRFQNRWQGDFVLNAQGVRFWDESADSPTGCQVKPDGMVCYTGRVPFMSWKAIFGAEWVDKQRTLNLGKIAGGIHFDGKQYWDFTAGRWYDWRRDDVFLHLKTQGVSTKVPRGQTASDADRVLNFIQEFNRVDGAGPIINKPPGIVDVDGKRILNISTVHALSPCEKQDVTPEDFPWLSAFVNGLFDSPEHGALDHFLAWLQRAYRCVLHYENAMGQAIFLCGPRENGKTLLCFHVVKPLLGNRIANPYDYFTGLTQFNEELFESFLLAINDEEAPSGDAARRKFDARMKAFVVNPSHTYHPKFQKRVNIPWSGRLFVTLNDDPESVGLLPEVNANTRDKMMFFGSRPYQGKWGDRGEIEARVAAELPYFARWLLNWKAPESALAGGRMGVASFYDPRILELSKQHGPAQLLLETIAIWCRQGPYWNNGVLEWMGTASELMNEFSVGFMDSQHLLREWNAIKASKALATLARQEKTGVRFIEGGNERKYRIIKAEVLKSEEVVVCQ